LISFALIGVLWLFVIPLLKIPEGNRSFVSYIKSIKLIKVNPVIKTVGLGLLVGGIMLCFIVFAGWTTALATDGTQIFFGNLLVNEEVPLNVYYALRPGIWEEVAFRGVIFALLMRKYSEKKTIIINGVLFGLFHLLNLINLFFYWGAEGSFILGFVFSTLFQVVYATIVGILLAYIFSKTRSLITVILIHYIIDAFIAFLTFVFYPSGPSMSDLIIRLTIMTTIGLGIVPCLVCFLIVYLVYKKWPSK
jgi:membrane protease YdiL (CAAX protease family)